MEKKTPLYDMHLALGGKMVPYAGFTLPIQYTSIEEEHLVVREKAGLFDVSHMGEILLTGKDALHTINTLLSNDFTTLKVEKARYSLMLNPNGGIMDDLLVYRLSDDEYKLVVNAANIEKDVRWIKQQLIGDTHMENISDKIGQLALQGPLSKEILKKLVKEEEIPTGFFSFIKDVKMKEANCLISQTGYTGSFGYEIYCKSEDTAMIWKQMMDVGQSMGLLPCGLGARDTLRIEAALPLYGQEMTDEISPFEADLAFAIKMNKAEDFIGKAPLTGKEQPQRMRKGLKITGRGIVRGECEVFAAGKSIGMTTSGTHMPYMNGAYAMALIDVSYQIGDVVSVSVRGRSIEAEIVSMPFYKKP